MDNHLIDLFEDEELALPALYRTAAGDIVPVRVVKRRTSSKEFSGYSSPAGIYTRLLVLEAQIGEPQSGDKVAIGYTEDAIATLPSDFWNVSDILAVNEFDVHGTGRIWSLSTEKVKRA